MSLEQKLIHVATREVGVREVNFSNTGKRVEEYQSATPLGGTGWPWCAAFISWCFLTAFGKVLCDTVWRRSADCDEILWWARRCGIASTTPSVGSVGLCMASKNDATHIFLVSATANSFVGTREGNTNSGGSRNGDGVYARKRGLPGNYLFLDWPKLVPASYSLPDGIFTVADSPIVKPPKPQMWDLLLGGKKADSVPIFDGHSYALAWKWSKWFGQDLGWDAPMQAVTLNGVPVPAQVRLIPDSEGQNRAWVPVSALAAATKTKSGAPLKVSSEPGKVLVTQ